MAKITIGGNPTTTSGDLPQIGSKAPSFAFVGTDMQEFSSEKFTGKKMILNIFPSVDTGVCAASIRAFNKAASELKNTVVLCLSMDLPFAQKRFCGAEGIENVVMGSGFLDGGRFGKDYGVSLMDAAFKGLYSRAVVVVDENGAVTYTEQVPEIGQEPDYEKALASI